MLRSFILAAAMLLAASAVQAQSLPQSSIEITYPKAGDVLMHSQFYTWVEVTSQGEFFSPVDYEYTTTGGASWELIRRDRFPGKVYIGDFNWDVPNIDAPEAQLRIRDSLGTTGLSGIFRIRKIPKINSVRVNNDRFPLPVNYDVVIEWTAEGELSPIDIEYTVAGFARYKIVYELDSTRRSYVWHTPKEPVGNVKLSVAAQNGGMAVVGPFEINYTNGVEDTKAGSADLTIYPNPAASMLNVKSALGGQTALVILTDITGRAALEQRVMMTAGEFSVDVSQVLPGNYMLTARSDETTLSRMITIAR